MLDNTVYTKLLDSFIATYQKENKFLEFKSNHVEAKVLGEYLSALSNGACLEHVDYGYLFFGVDNSSLKVKGTSFNPEKVHVTQGKSLEFYLRLNISPRLTSSLTNSYIEGKTVWLL